jgi:diadenosine tetraphosphate (Ap4A) HIT family hydrolase
MQCELCAEQLAGTVFENEELRVILVDDAKFPGFCRVIWRAHVKEMSDLSAAQRGRFMDVVFAVESVQKTVLCPDKINLASLGNVVPHLHWHVIPRYVDDAFFPQPIWGQEQRDASLVTAQRAALLPEFTLALQSALKQI